MLTLINFLVAIFLEKKTKKNSNNSSIPPSQTEKDESSDPKTGTHSKGKNTLRNNGKNAKIVEHVRLIEVHQCDVCGQDLSEAVCQHVDAEVKHCDVCDSMVKGKFPKTCRTFTIR